MKLSQAIQRANAGDRKCMIAVADYYGLQHQYEEAEAWYEQAARKGDSAYAVYMLIELYNLDALTDIEIQKWEDGLNSVTKVFVNATKLQDKHQILQLRGSDGKYLIENVLNLMDEAAFSRAICLFEMGDYATVLSAFEKKDEPRFLVLRALSTCMAVPDGSSDETYQAAYDRAFPMMKAAIESDYQPRSFIAQLRYSQCASYYANLLRGGWLEDDKKDGTMAAYEMLTNVRSKLTDADAISLMDDTLSHYHYKKGVFGTSCTYKD